MKLELPDNNASVLFHMGNALQSIAKDLGMDTHARLSDELTKAIEEMKKSAPPILQPADADALRYSPENLTLNSKGDVINDAVEPLITPPEVEFTEQQASYTTPEVSDTIDADGLPWDQRIHSRGKTRLADNTWRMARKPNDKTDEEWAEYVEGVKTELKALMDIPVTVTYDSNEADPFAIEPPIDVAVVTPPIVISGISIVGITQAETNVDNLPPVTSSATFEAIANGDIGAGQPVRIVTPPVVDAVVTPPVVDAVVTPPVVIEAPEVVTPPVVDAVVTGPTTFPELMKFITVNNKKLTKESVDEALKAQGLASIALLAARTDLIPQIHAALVKLL